MWTANAGSEALHSALAPAGPPAEVRDDPDGLLNSRSRGGQRKDWRDQAACLSEDPELFFPTGNAGPAIAQIEEAKAVCRRCAVTEACLTYALQTGQDVGVWGGLSEEERRALSRRHARTRRAGGPDLSLGVGAAGRVLGPHRRAACGRPEGTDPKSVNREPTAAQQLPTHR